MLEIAIIGVGAMGCLFAGGLASYAEVSMLGHWPQQLDALRKGLTLVTLQGDRKQIQVKVHETARTLPRVQLALVLVKSYQTETAARELREALADDGLALTLQNGLGNVEILADTLGSDRVLAGTTTEGATLEGVGVVRHAGAGVTTLSRIEHPQASTLLTFGEILQMAGFRVAWSENLRVLVWQKLAVNAAINPLTALLETPNGFLVANEAARTIMRKLAREVASVAQALGLDVSAEVASQQAEEVAARTSKNLSSMLQDVLNRRQTELRAITGAIVEQASASETPVPVNHAVYELLQSKLRGENWRSKVQELSPQIQKLFARLPGYVEE